MTRNLKALGLALLAVFALGAVAAQGASAADEHEFHSDGPKTILTGKIHEGTHTFNIGAAGIVECTGAVFESTIDGATQIEGKETYAKDEITVVPTYSGCSFGGQPATVKFNHCAYVFDSDTTTGNTTGGKHAKVTIECETGNKIEVHTVNCTITVPPQVIPDAVTYTNEPPSAITISATAHNVEVGKERNTASQPALGCAAFPTGKVAKYTGKATAECFKDENIPTPSTTERTTPSGTEDKTPTACTVKAIN